jgi:hypothetical protein
MSGPRDAAKKGLDFGLAAIRHTGWWLRWQTDRGTCREVTELGLLPARTAEVERPAA